jgi:23S rRNA (cytidine1920-2'-O)/16S rRNA (cytidine1409-2'-O)-methyltransferase
LREILPAVARIAPGARIAAMVKPQFEAGKSQTNKGVIKNDSIRRQILKDFEVWAKQYFVIVDKADSDVAGAKGNRERFYLLKALA